MALALCLMSAIGFADNRQMVAALPSNIPSVTLTIDGKNKVVKPTKAIVKEVDDRHVKCIVYANNDRAAVTLPISYDTILQLGEKVAEVFHALDIVTDKHTAMLDSFQLIHPATLAKYCQRYREADAFF